MKKALTAALAALTFGGAVVATAMPAQAQRYHRSYDRHYHHHRDRSGDALAAGVVGLALGAAIASSANNDRGYRSGYGGSYSYGYYDYDRPRYRRPICEDRRWVYDPYLDRRVMIREQYRC